MGKSVKGTAVEEVIRGHLLAKGYSVSHPRGRGETGVDIEGKKDGSRYLVEAIGFQDSPRFGPGSSMKHSSGWYQETGVRKVMCWCWGFQSDSRDV